MASANFSANVSGAGVVLSGAVNRSGDNVAGYDPVLPVGKAGTLTTRTDNDTGEATLSPGHGITTGLIVDVYWTGGRRYGMTVGVVAGNVVPIDGGAGDNLPVATTALVVTPRVQINVGIDGDLLELLGIQAVYADQSSTAKAQVSFYDAGDALIAHVDMTANIIQVWDIDGGATNVFTGNPITYAMATNGSSTATTTLKLVVCQDATP